MLLLYLLGSIGLLLSAMGMALLPHFAPFPWLFLLVGAPLSGVVAGSWLLITVTADSRPRLHTGPVLALAGLVGVLWSAYLARWPAAGWALLQILIGIPLWISLRRAAAQKAPRAPKPVRHPVGRAGDTAGHDSW